MSEHPTAAGVRRGFERFAAGDPEGLLIAGENGRWVDIRAQPLDQAAFDAFWR